MKFLLRCGADAERMITRGDAVTPLVLAAWYDHAPVVEQLLEHGVDTERVMPSGKAKGKTALQIAIIKGHGGVVDLLEKGSEEPPSPSASHNMEDSEEEEEDEHDDEDFDETWKPSKGFRMDVVEDDSEDDDEPKLMKKPAPRKPATKRPAPPSEDDDEPVETEVVMRKMNPFIYFSQQKRAVVKAEVEASIDAEATPPELFREVNLRIGALWKALSDADKQKWKDEAPEKETTVKMKKIAAPVLDCVEIKFRAPHAVDATSSLRDCVCSMAWEVHTRH